MARKCKTRTIMPGDRGNRTNKPMVLHGRTLYTGKYKKTRLQKLYWKRQFGIDI